MATNQTITVCNSVISMINRILTTMLGYEYVDDIQISSILETGFSVTFSNGYSLVSEVVTFFDLSNVLTDKEIEEIEQNEIKQETSSKINKAIEEYLTATNLSSELAGFRILDTNKEGVLVSYAFEFREDEEIFITFKELGL